MTDRPATLSAALSVLVLCCSVAAGCAGVKHKPADAVVPPAAPAMPAASAPAPQPPVVSPPEIVTAPAAPVAPEVRVAREPAVPPQVVEPVPPAQRAAPAPRVVVPKAPVAATKSPPAIAPTPAPAPKDVSKATQAPAVSPPAAAPLDFASLGTRLRQTRAIGTLTKLSLKNQVDDLLGKFRAYHKRQGTATLPELRRSYDMLLLKVLSLLQDSDPPLARDIVQSRAAIWGILADPRKFTESNLMAGAAT
jgi:outer membrane biosynthesis protein TonB